MKTTIETFYTPDGYLLHGALYTPIKSTNRILLYTHGLSGNFYENAFISHIAEACCNSGVAFFSFNNRGHDYISDIIRPKHQEESTRIGGAYDHFADSKFDYEGAIHFVKSLRYTSVILGGHSSGSNKALYSYNQIERDSLIGIILLSPCDDTGLLESSGGISRDKLIAHAKKLVSDGNDRLLMPEEAFFGYPLSAKTFLDMFGDNSLHDVFSYRKGSASLSSFSELSIPLLTVFGDDDFISTTPREIFSMIRSALPSDCEYENAVVPGGHSYNGGEESLKDVLRHWLSTL